MQVAFEDETEYHVSIADLVK